MNTRRGSMIKTERRHNKLIGEKFRKTKKHTFMLNYAFGTGEKQSRFVASIVSLDMVRKEARKMGVTIK